MSNKVTKRNAHALSLNGLLVIVISDWFRDGNYHAAMPVVVALIGFGMVCCGVVLLSRLIARQEVEIAKLQNQIEGQGAPEVQHLQFFQSLEELREAPGPMEPLKDPEAENEEAAVQKTAPESNEEAI